VDDDVDHEVANPWTTHECISCGDDCDCPGGQENEEDCEGCPECRGDEDETDDEG